MTQFRLSSIQFFWFANESLASRRGWYGTIHWSAVVHPDDYMDGDSVVGPFSVVGANVRMYSYSQIASHVIVEEGADLWTRAVVLNHAHIKSNASIGINSTCEEFTTVERRGYIRNGAILKQHSVVMSYGDVGACSIVGHHSLIGRKTELGDHVCIEQHVHIGSHARLGSYAVVHEFVTVPYGSKIDDRLSVISAPETDILLRALRRRQYSKR